MLYEYTPVALLTILVLIGTLHWLLYGNDANHSSIYDGKTKNDSNR